MQEAGNWHARQSPCFQMLSGVRLERETLFFFFPPHPNLILVTHTLHTDAATAAAAPADAPAEPAAAPVKPATGPPPSAKGAVTLVAEGASWKPPAKFELKNISPVAVATTSKGDAPGRTLADVFVKDLAAAGGTHDALLLCTSDKTSFKVPLRITNATYAPGKFSASATPRGPSDPAPAAGGAVSAALQKGPELPEGAAKGFTCESAALVVDATGERAEAGGDKGLVGAVVGAGTGAFLCGALCAAGGAWVGGAYGW